MASERDDAVFPEEDDSQEDDDEELENDDVVAEDEEDLNSGSPSIFSLPLADPASIVTVAVPGNSVFNGNPSTSHSAVVAGSDAKLESLTVPEEKKLQQPLDESRKLFQRLWTDEDEIELLQGFLDYTTPRGSSHHPDTALFYDQIKSKLQLDFNKNQLVEKLRRLKKKYRNVVAKISSGKDFSFKSPHDQATFEISRKIWSNTGRVGVEDNTLDDDEESNPNPNPNFINGEVRNEDILGNSAEKKMTPRSRKRSRSRADERPVLDDGLATANGSNSNTHTTGLIEETVRICLSPLFKELLSNAVGQSSRGFGAMAFNPFGGLTSMNCGVGEMVDEKWRKQQILELEVYAKRLELIQDQIKTNLEELRSRGG